ncbi:hypothetical protein V2J09_011338 [Rumex salicifolius]
MRTTNVDKLLHLRASSDQEILISKIKSGGTDDQILRTLMQDEACNTIILNHEFVGHLLYKFKDDWKSALVIFRWAETRPGFKHSSESYDMMVDILGKARRFDEMIQLVEEISQRNSVTLTTIAKMMRRYAGADLWGKVVKVFDDLDTYGLKKNTESMNLLLDALCKEKQVDRAREVFMELRSHIAPNANTFNIFIHGWCKINHVDEAYWTIQEMKGNGFHPCVISYSTIIQSYCHQSNYDKVYELLDEMDTQKCPANIVTYTTIMSSLTKSEELDEALRITDRMKSVGCKPDAQFYNALIHTLGKAGRVRDAFHVFNEAMPQNGVLPNTSTYNTMIAMFCRVKREERAFKLLEEMKREGKCKPDVQSFYPLLKSCFRTGTIQSYLNGLLDEMTNKYHLSLDVSAYTLLIHGLCKAHEPEWAHRLFEQMIGQGLRPRELTCQLMLDELRSSRLDDAVEKVEAYVKQMKGLQS